MLLIVLFKSKGSPSSDTLISQSAKVLSCSLTGKPTAPAAEILVAITKTDR